VTQLRVVRYAFATGWSEFRAETWIPGWFIRFIAQALFFAMLGQLLDSPERFYFLLVGNMVAVGTIATAIAVPQSTWDRLDGTYPLLVVAPTNLLFPTLGRTLCRFVGAMGFSIASYTVLSLMFMLPQPWPGVLVIPLLLALICGSCYCLMLFMGAVANFVPNARNLVHNVTTMSLMAFAGVNVPVTFWPGPVQFLANCLPITHGLGAIRLLLAGAGWDSVLAEAGLELLVAAFWLTLAALTMDWMANAGRANGSIEFVG
jgi:ABC-2 type transport system permease protein